MFRLTRFFLIAILIAGCKNSETLAEVSRETGPSIRNINCKSEPLKPAFLLLDVADFGPPALSADFTGRHWYEWNATGSSDPDDTYDIFVVVYAGGAEDLARAEFQDDKRPGLERDFRFRSLQSTDRYLDDKIAEQTAFAEDETDSMRPMFLKMAEELKALKKKLAENVCETY